MFDLLNPYICIISSYFIRHSKMNNIIEKYTLQLAGHTGDSLALMSAHKKN